ncbi:MAG: UDP-N-acetylmuramate dehydrogenase [Clostridia bacterium]|nr:UDP-N-acetylmuramate dehydrogenase [Clostridia bacterium]
MNLDHVFDGSSFRAEQLLFNEPMSRHTTFRVGGPADLIVMPESSEQVIEALRIARENDVPVLVIGNGSNLIVKDNGIRGIVILLGDKFSDVTADGTTITAQAGATLARLAAVARNNALTGLEFASGIPGTVGGGCAMNAGAYGGELSDVLIDATVLLNGEVVTLSKAEMEMSYRSTKPLREGGIVLTARFELKPGDPDTISATMKDLNGRRRDKQPLEFPSAGSTFKRPVGYFAGALIEQAGLKGYSVGGAQVSPKHAGFVINTGNATAEDILSLIRHVQQVILEKDGVTLETEVRIVGE